MDIRDTNTWKNIKTSLEGESQAIVRYLLCADIAKKEQREEDARLFQKMAQNEMEHAKLWCRYIDKEIGTTMENLLRAASNENEEWKNMYPQFAREAKKEGLNEIALLFERIASIECDHERKFLEQSIKNSQGSTRIKEKDTKNYTCLLCGYCASEKLEICPVCDGQDTFE